MTAPKKELPIPPHFDPHKVGEVWPVPYQQRAEDALAWARKYNLQPVAKDKIKIELLLIDIQNTFCIPGYELFVGGRTGLGAVEDNIRLCEFIYRNLGSLTHITPTLDTHQAMQIFHPIFLVNEQGAHPAPYTLISYDDLLQGRWKFNPNIASSLGINAIYGQQLLNHYAKELKERQKYDLTIWPYHVMRGSIGNALVSAVEEAIFFHTIARNSQPDFELKGNNPFTEHYSALGPEVMDGPHGEQIAVKNQEFMQELHTYDVVVIAGQAKSHCVAWTIDDLLGYILEIDESLVKKVYLLEDCSSPVVIPGVIDYSDQADAAYQRFAQAGMHIVRSTEPIHNWLDV